MDDNELFHTKGLCGLNNLGNTCYLNSIIHCLNNQYEFIKDLYQEQDDDENILNEFIKLSREIYIKNGVVSPDNFLAIVRKTANDSGNTEYVIPTEPKCASEFFTFLLDKLGEINNQEVNIKVKYNFSKYDEYNKKIHNEALKVFKQHFKNNYSNIIKYFYGQYINIMRDSKNKLSYQYDPYNIIQLSVNNRNNNIYDCFNEFCSIEKLNSSSYRQVKFYSFPKILVLQFKRNIFSVKNNKLITFPHLLDMNKYYIGTQDKKFELVGVCNHYGDNSFGHYTAYTKNYNENWYEFNDNNVYSASPDKIVSRNAYILFYREIN